MTALQTLPQAEASLAHRDHLLSPHHTLDAKIYLTVANQHVTLLVEVKRTVFPRDIPQILDQFRTIRNIFVRSAKQKSTAPCAE